MEHRPPAEHALDPGAVQLEEVGLVGAAVVDAHPLHSAPGGAEEIRQLPGGHAVAVVRPHIVISLIFPVLILPGGNLQVHRQGLQHMLVGPGGVGISQHDVPPRLGRPHAVGDDPVVGVVAPADDISRPAGGHGAAPSLKEGFLVAVGHQLRAGLAVGVGVIAVQGVCLPVAVLPLPVVVHLVRGHV